MSDILFAILSVIAFLLAWSLMAPGSWTCSVFGHKPHECTYSGEEYMRVVPGAIDGIGREHATLYARCPRCSSHYRAGQIHLIPRSREQELDNALRERTPTP